MLPMMPTVHPEERSFFQRIRGRNIPNGEVGSAANSHNQQGMPIQASRAAIEPVDQLRAQRADRSQIGRSTSQLLRDDSAGPLVYQMAKTSEDNAQTILGFHQGYLTDYKLKLERFPQHSALWNARIAQEVKDIAFYTALIGKQQMALQHLKGEFLTTRQKELTVRHSDVLLEALQASLRNVQDRVTMMPAHFKYWIKGLERHTSVIATYTRATAGERAAFSTMRYENAGAVSTIPRAFLNFHEKGLRDGQQLLAKFPADAEFWNADIAYHRQGVEYFKERFGN